MEGKVQIQFLVYWLFDWRKVSIEALEMKERLLAGYKTNLRGLRKNMDQDAVYVLRFDQPALVRIEIWSRVTHAPPALALLSTRLWSNTWPCKIMHYDILRS